MASGRMPVLVGVGQLVNHSKDPALGGDPVEYMVACAKRAGHDAHIPHILPKIDSLGIIQVMSRDYTHELKGVAGGLGAHPRDFVYTTTGATIPQILTARLCRRIARGQSEAGLICGAEAFYSGQKPDWEKLTTPRYDQIPYPLVGDVRDHATDLERRYGLHVPSNVYPLFANAFRKARGLSLEAYIRNTALLCETFSQVARDQEYAWFRDGKKAPEIATVTQSNRMINYPFTKYMNAIMNVDQAAALLIVSEDKADSLHIPEERRVYLLGSSEVYEKWYVSDRINYHASPGLELAFEKVFEEARTGREGIHYWELYSCFPVAVQIAMETLSLPEKTVPTVIGGLPYFGGPGNHYALHAICEMVRLLRERPERRGLVECLSWHMHKFAVGIYSGVRPEGFHLGDPEEYAHDVEKGLPQRRVLEQGEGVYTLETYSVSYDQEGRPRSGLVVANTGEGDRIYAVNGRDMSLVTAMTTEEPIGKRVRISYDPLSGLNRFSDLW